MVTSIGMVASIGSVASRPGESVPSVAEGESARLTRPRVRPREPRVGPADGGRPCVAGGGVVSCATPPARLAARPGRPVTSR